MMFLIPPNLEMIRRNLFLRSLPDVALQKCQSSVSVRPLSDTSVISLDSSCHIGQHFTTVTSTFNSVKINFISLVCVIWLCMSVKSVYIKSLSWQWQFMINLQLLQKLIQTTCIPFECMINILVAHKCQYNGLRPG